MDDLIKRLEKLEKWREAREAQQLTAPLDDRSRLALRAFTDGGFGTITLTQGISVPSVPASFTVPKAFTGTIILEGPNGRIEVPYY